MTLSDFITLLQNEFAFQENQELKSESKLMETFSGSSLNLLFLRSIVEDNFHILLKDADIKTCETIQDLYLLIQSKSAN